MRLRLTWALNCLLPDEIDVQDKSWTPDEIDVQDKSWTPDEIEDSG
jgi:hypothetical protein